jgi:hypothetical protein
VDFAGVILTDISCKLLVVFGLGNFFGGSKRVAKCVEM